MCEYRKGFVHGYGVGSQNENMCFNRFPSWEEVNKWAYDPIEIALNAPFPGSIHEKGVRESEKFKEDYLKAEASCEEFKKLALELDDLMEKVNEKKEKIKNCLDVQRSLGFFK